MPKTDCTYNHVCSRREIMDLLRYWEPKLRACGSDWESETARLHSLPHTPCRQFDVAGFGAGMPRLQLSVHQKT